MEDVFHGHSRNRSKADYYTKHLFIRVLCHELLPDGHIASNDGYAYTSGPRTSSPEPMNPYPEEDDEEKKMDTAKNSVDRHSTLVQRRNNTKRSILPTNRDDVKPSSGNRKAPSPAGTGLSKLVSREQAVSG